MKDEIPRMPPARSITVVYIETREPKQEIVDRCLASVPGAIVQLYTRPERKLLRCENHVPPDGMLASESSWRFLSHLTRFILHDVPARVRTSHILFVQNDGYPINPASWTDQFFGYDYLGAPVRWEDWLHLLRPGVPYRAYYVKDFWEVGNGGFSLRSVALLRQCSQLMQDAFAGRDDLYGLWEDFLICKVLRPHLRGVKFGEFDIAKRFSCEQYDAFAGERPFGFHAGGDVPMLVEHALPLI